MKLEEQHLKGIGVNVETDSMQNRLESIEALAENEKYKFGYFNQEGDEFVITNPETPEHSTISFGTTLFSPASSRQESVILITRLMAKKELNYLPGSVEFVILMFLAVMV